MLIVKGKTNFSKAARSAAAFVRFSFLAIALFLFHVSSSAQRAGNLGSFDSRQLHYGIQIGLTQSKFDLQLNEDAALRDTMQGVTSYYVPGFHIAVIGDLKLGEFFNLRLLPGVTIITRNLTYSWENGYLATHRLAEQERIAESVYGDLPIELKFRAKRYGNFRPYITAGGSYGFDFASLRKNRNRNNESILRLQANDLRYTMGLGFDFFLRYVKFAIELKMNFGLLDLEVPDPEIYVRSMDQMKSRTVMISFTFEG